MPREDRLRLRRERVARLARHSNRTPARLLRLLREQRDDLAANRLPLARCPDLRDLVRAARAASGLRVEFSGRTFSVRRGLVFSGVYTRNGELLAYFPGEIFDV
ncbi:hypothetical protein [Thiomonas sp.]